MLRKKKPHNEEMRKRSKRKREPDEDRGRWNAKRERERQDTGETKKQGCLLNNKKILFAHTKLKKFCKGVYSLKKKSKTKSHEKETKHPTKKHPRAQKPPPRCLLAARDHHKEGTNEKLGN